MELTHNLGYVGQIKWAPTFCRKYFIDYRKTYYVKLLPKLT